MRDERYRTREAEPPSPWLCHHFVVTGNRPSRPRTRPPPFAPFNARGRAVARSSEKFGAKTLDTAIQIQSDFAKSSYEGFVARATKFGELYQNLAKEVYKPVEAAFAKMSPVAK